jgi:quinone-modifying oxidoreductase subunit QmoB
MGKTGCYLCEGCGIAEALDVAALQEVARRVEGPVRTSKAFCLEDARLIREDVEREGLEAVVIAACSPRVNRDVFRTPGAFVERVNWREQVVWSHPPGEETQSLARDYLEMGIARAERAKPPNPSHQPGERTILVVGGGPAGVSAAISAARAGFGVVLVEKAERLGGFAARLYKQYAERPPFDELQAPSIDGAIAALEALPNVTIELDSHVAEISGQPGRFTARVAAANGRDREHTVGAIVVATGWRPLDGAAYARYGLGAHADVVSGDRFEEMARRGAIVRPSDGAPAERIAFLLCDAEDDAGLPYGGAVASLVALKQAAYVRERNPGATAYVFYRDLHALGLYEYFYRRVQADPGVMLCQGKRFNVKRDSPHGLSVEAEETLLGGSIELPVDLVVLATGMKPELDGDGGALNLRYLQGDTLPRTRFGFADSNFICFPFETQRTGIYTAGSVRAVMDLAAAQRDGRAAALKAMQAIEHASTGEAVHPRSGDLTFPEFFIQKCTSCGRCTQECPFGALELNERRQPTLNPNRCRRCGICMGACPVQIISFADYSVDVLSNMIRAVEIPEDGEEKPRILAFACENDAYPALDMAGIRHLQTSVTLRVIPVRCLGSVNSILVTDAVSRGFDGVALLGCKPGEDYQCHFIRGSQLLGTRMDNMRETLGRLMLEPERVSVLEVAISDAYRLPEMLEAFVRQIQALGPNPMKGFA